jgi:hypothetical protein
MDRPLITSNLMEKENFISLEIVQYIWNMKMRNTMEKKVKSIIFSEQSPMYIFILFVLFHFILNGKINFNPINSENCKNFFLVFLKEKKWNKMKFNIKCFPLSWTTDCREMWGEYIAKYSSCQGNSLENWNWTREIYEIFKIEFYWIFTEFNIFLIKSFEIYIYGKTVKLWKFWSFPYECHKIEENTGNIYYWLVSQKTHIISKQILNP